MSRRWPGCRPSPCLVDLLGELRGRRCDRKQLALVPELAQAMGLASICGLGQVAANPLTSLLKHFPEDLARYFPA